MKLIIIIPALNEEKTIGDVVNRIPKAIAGIAKQTIVVVSDGSRDQTENVAAAAGAVVLRHQKTRGVGAAFRTGVRYALEQAADVTVNIDADGQFNPTDIPQLVAPIIANEADFVTTTRFGKKEFEPKMPGLKRWGNTVVTKMISSITGQKFTDVSCGFRAYGREALLRLNLFGDFTYTQETFIDLAEKGLRIVEIPLLVRGVREHGTSRVANNILKYAYKSFSIILRSARDTKPIKFFGGIGLVIFMLGLITDLLVFIYWLLTGRTTPYQNVILLGVVLVLLGFLLMILALITDMLDRQRKIQEDILYFEKRKIYYGNHHNGTDHLEVTGTS